MTGHASAALAFTVVDRPGTLTVDDPRLVVAGYTGRDRAAVQHHIDELAAIGIPPPESVPAFYPLDGSLLTTADTVEVTGELTSGEVEPVLVRSGGRLFLGVGSDHTDRRLERESVAGSKAACPKPIGAELIELPASGFDWDAVRASTMVDGTPYQRGTLGSLRVPTEVLDLHDQSPDGAAGADVVMFCGTLPLLDGGFRHGEQWEMALQIPAGPTLRLAYAACRPR